LSNWTICSIPIIEHHWKHRSSKTSKNSFMVQGNQIKAKDDQQHDVVDYKSHIIT